MENPKNEIREWFDKNPGRDEIAIFYRDIAMYHATADRSQCQNRGRFKRNLKGDNVDAINNIISNTNLKYLINGEDQLNLNKLQELKSKENFKLSTIDDNGVGGPTDSYNTLLEASKQPEQEIRKKVFRRTKLFTTDRIIRFSYNLSKFYLKVLLNSTNSYSGITEERVMEAIEADNVEGAGNRYEWRDGKLFDKSKDVNVDDDALKKEMMKTVLISD